MFCYYSKRLIVSFLSSNKIRILWLQLSQHICSQCQVSIPPENLRNTGRFSDFFKVHNVTLGRNRLRQANYVKNIFFFQSVAHDDIISVVRCNCKETKKGRCTSAKCSYRSNGLKRVSACGYCRGDGCDNSSLYTNG